MARTLFSNAQPAAPSWSMMDFTSVTTLCEEEITEVVRNPATSQKMRSALQYLQKCSREMESLNPWVNEILSCHPERLRRFISHFGKIYATARCEGTDVGNAVMTLCWRFHVDTGVNMHTRAMMCSVSSYNSSGNVFEFLLGLDWLLSTQSQLTWPDWLSFCMCRGHRAFEDQFAAAHGLLEDLQLRDRCRLRRARYVIQPFVEAMYYITQSRHGRPDLFAPMMTKKKFDCHACLLQIEALRLGWNSTTEFVKRGALGANPEFLPMP